MSWGYHQVTLKEILKLIRWSRVTIFTGIYLAFTGFLIIVCGHILDIEFIPFAPVVIFTGLTLTGSGLLWRGFYG